MCGTTAGTNLRKEKNVGVKIEPRKSTDRGGYLMMPLRANVPKSGDDTWRLTNCPNCGCECWSRPLPQGMTEDMFTGRLCTMCALREGR